ncbi:hypothetical protein J2Z21_005683 [Streptomyces griseochromogenes]|uniref:Threonine/serine exporter-like N-terminal domain-containing protein n=1 Tax=Streptomyces griseochromogenes TaxID=68214 RepID=A0A1B1BA11_9ACTN|nr:hypothetical protein [Streptomyces griseochromogenes]ANP55675.1 hypothetical protein AVL59_44195 [Streptomyces griseochromogenes]MBP2052696.1 hypothetical protein [Streptomyces griseochromogenes]
MSYLRTFLPWIVFAVIPSGQWQWGALAALVIAVATIAQQRRSGAGFDALLIEAGSAVFFAVLAAVAFADPHSGVHAYSAALSSGTLAVVAGVSLAVRRPFTLGIAKRTTPREYWDLKPFIRINVVITAVWTAAFVLTAVVLAVLAHSGHAHSTPATVVQIAGFAVPMVFTVRYVAHVQAKAGQAAR